MGFRKGSWLGLLSGVLLWGCLGAQADEANVAITVLVNDSVHLEPKVLEDAEEEAGRIFHAAGIEISWVNCGSGNNAGRCRVQPGWNEFELHIVVSGQTSGDSVFGEAFLGADGTGKYSDIFFGRIEQTVQHSTLRTERLLGSVAAHELGHLLLGRRPHSRWGIMEAVWRKEELHQVGIGALLFSAEDSKLMRKRMGAVKMANVNVPSRKDYWSVF